MGCSIKVHIENMRCYSIPMHIDRNTLMKVSIVLGRQGAAAACETKLSFGANTGLHTKT